jgi:hypothetical protein
MIKVVMFFICKYTSRFNNLNVTFIYYVKMMRVCVNYATRLALMTGTLHNYTLNNISLKPIVRARHAASQYGIRSKKKSFL